MASLRLKVAYDIPMMIKICSFVFFYLAKFATTAVQLSTLGGLLYHHAIGCVTPAYKKELGIKRKDPTTISGGAFALLLGFRPGLSYAWVDAILFKFFSAPFEAVAERFSRRRCEDEDADGDGQQLDRMIAYHMSAAVVPFAVAKKGSAVRLPVSTAAFFAVPPKETCLRPFKFQVAPLENFALPPKGPPLHVSEICGYQLYSVPYKARPGPNVEVSRILHNPRLRVHCFILMAPFRPL